MEAILAQTEHSSEDVEAPTGELQWQNALSAGFVAPRGDGRDAWYRYACEGGFRLLKQRRHLTANGRGKAVEVFNYFADQPIPALPAQVLDRGLEPSLEKAGPRTWSHEDFKAWWQRVGRPDYVAECVLRDEEAWNMVMEEHAESKRSPTSSPNPEEERAALLACPKKPAAASPIPFTISPETLANFLDSASKGRYLEADALHLQLPLVSEASRSWRRAESAFRRIAFEQQTYGRGQNWIGMDYLALLTFEASGRTLNDLEARLAADRILNLRVVQQELLGKFLQRNRLTGQSTSSKDGEAFPRGSDVVSADNVKLHTFLGWVSGASAGCSSTRTEGMVVKLRYRFYRALRELCDSASALYGDLEQLCVGRILNRARLRGGDDAIGSHELRMNVGQHPEEAGDGMTLVFTLYPGEKEPKKKQRPMRGPSKERKAPSKPHRMDVPPGTGMMLAFDFLIRDDCPSEGTAQAVSAMERLFREFVHPLLKDGLPMYLKFSVVAAHSGLVDAPVIRLLILWSREVDIQRYLQRLECNVVPYKVVKVATIEMTTTASLVELLQDPRFCLKRDFSARVHGKLEINRSLVATMLQEVVDLENDRVLARRRWALESRSEQAKVRDRTKQAQGPSLFPRTIAKVWQLFHPLIARGRPDGGPPDPHLEAEDRRRAEDALRRARGCTVASNQGEQLAPAHSARTSESATARNLGTRAPELSVRATTLLESKARRRTEDRWYGKLLSFVRWIRASRSTFVESKVASVRDLLESRFVEALLHPHARSFRAFLGEGCARQQLLLLLELLRRDIEAGQAEARAVRAREARARMCRTAEEVLADGERAQLKARLREKLARLGISEEDMQELDQEQGPGVDATAIELLRFYSTKRADAIDSAMTDLRTISSVCDALCSVNLQASGVNVVVEVSGFEIFDVLQSLLTGENPGDAKEKDDERDLSDDHGEKGDDVEAPENPKPWAGSGSDSASSDEFFPQVG
eukprot:scaffold1384_cov256-Pinguiococcus_pyrenoidosus.AAC.10